MEAPKANTRDEKELGIRTADRFLDYIKYVLADGTLNFNQIVASIDRGLGELLDLEDRMESRNFVNLMAAILEDDELEGLLASKLIYKDLLKLAIRQISCSAVLSFEEAAIIRVLVSQSAVEDEVIIQYIESILRMLENSMYEDEA